MDEKKNLLGVTIDNINTVQAMERARKFMETEALNTIGMITTNVLLEATGSDTYQKQLCQLDLRLIGDREVLEAAGVDSAERRMEAENHWFVRTFLEYLAEQGRSLMLICGSVEEEERVLDYLREHYPELNLAGACVPDDGKEDVDGLVNLVNGISPDVILVTLLQPLQEEFMAQNKAKLEARILLGAGKMFLAGERSELKSKFLERLWNRRKWKKTLSQCLHKKGESDHGIS